MGTRRGQRAVVAAIAVAAASIAAPAAAQQAGAEAAAGDSIGLVYERESFVYPARSRPDPFRPLVGGAGIGPRVEALTVKGIIYARERSVALIVDGSGKTYRLRRGQIIGNARVLDIRPSQVLFAVDEFGTIRQHALELQRGPTQGTGQ